VFALAQPYEAFRHYQNLIIACATESKQHPEEFGSNVDPPKASTPVSPEAASNRVTH